MKKISIAILLIAIYLPVISQKATDITSSSGISNASYNIDGTTPLNDFDADGYIDYLLFRNDSLNFIDYSYLLPSGYEPIKFVDLNNSGYLDIVAFKQISHIPDTIIIFYNTLPDSIGFERINNNSNTFVFNSMSISVDIGTGDVNNDGLIDIILKDKLLINRFDSSGFVAINNSFSDYWLDSHLYDINNNGYLDLLIGNKIYINNGFDSLNIFQTPYQYNLETDLNIMSIADFNNNGYWDIYAQTKYDPYYQPGLFFSNNQNSGFTPYINNGITNPSYQIISFDYNNDGKLDIIAADNNSNSICKAYNQDSAGYFSDDSSFFYKSNFGYRSIYPADFDNDNDLDFIIHSYPLTLYRTDSVNPNTPPNPPQYLYTVIDSNKIIFHWDKATDNETPQASLTYNIRAGSTPNGVDIISPMANVNTGKRLVVEHGNCGFNNFYILNKANFNPNDTIYWSVQTIDNGYASSNFANEIYTIICNSLTEADWDTICSNDSLYWQGNYYSDPGRYYQTYSNQNFCFYSFVLELEANPAYLNQQTVDICAGNTYSWNGNNYYVSGTYTQNHTTTKGCDSIDKLVLNVRQTYTNILSDSICIGDSIQIGRKWFTDEGYYIDTLNSIHSCDSIIWLDLKTNPNDTNIIVQGTKLIGQDFSASYRWLDCDAQLFIPGANKRVFSPFLDGNYAAEISLNGCSYLTKCYSINGTGIRNLESSNIKIFPNPTESFVIIESQNQQISKIVLKSIDGKVLKIIEDINSTNQKIDLSSFEKGIYIFSIWLEEEVFYYKVLRQ